MSHGNAPVVAPPAPSDSHFGRRHFGQEEEGVEVVLSPDGPPTVEPSGGRDQSIFRGPQQTEQAADGTVRPRAMRAPHQRGPPPPPVQDGSGSYGYGEYYHPGPPPPMQVPLNPSGSFEEQAYPAQTQHYSPHVQYPQPGGRNDVNVISPNHKPEHSYRPPMHPRQRHPGPYYQYPPTSPVSRPDYHPDDGTFNRYPYETEQQGQGRPPVVAESSFDSDNYTSSHHSQSQYSSQTPAGMPPSYEEGQGFYGPGGTWGSFDTAPPPPPPGAPPHFDDYRYYGYPQPDSPYSHYPEQGAPYYHGDQPYSPAYDSRYAEDEQRMLGGGDYQQHPDGGYAAVTPHGKMDGSPATDITELTSNKSANGMVLPEASREIDFEVTNPPREPVIPPSDHPLVESLSLINSNDVLLGRGGGTNSQLGNRRFRKLVTDFQPTYLLARRKEKPLLARTIVIIIRRRGGRFLKKNDETGELYEVGDIKAEAKTSQALREGLDVRATKAAQTGKKPKKKKTKKAAAADKDKDAKKEEEKYKDDKKEDETPKADEVKSDDAPAKSAPTEDSRSKTPVRVEQGDEKMAAPESPPALPRLSVGSGVVHPHSPEAFAFRKRRRMRSKEGKVPLSDKLFPDFCPPRADLGRTASPIPTDDAMHTGDTPPRDTGIKVTMENPDDDFPDPQCQGGCAGIALSVLTGAPFCMGPSNWGSKK